MAQNGEKSGSAFYPMELVARVRKNVERFGWAAEMRDGIVEEARPWLEFEDEALWGMMFGHTITRSWMVWS
ncbi:MAG: hypothetical protein HOC74_38370, partial [Gemmatimonadetes bacterium]|nr:hypothetical protein [Gemmatimonadota bacterium]